MEERRVAIENKEEDYEAIRKVLEGNDSAFGLLQNKYKRLIHALIRKMIKDEKDVEDLTQETFIKAYRSLKTFNFEYSFSSWIYKIASNNCIDFLRKRRFPTISLNQPFYNSDDDYFLQIKDDKNRADLNILANERKNALREAIDELPERYGTIIKLRHENDMEYVEIAEKLDLPLGTVKAHLFRARKMLFAKLKKKRHLFSDN